MIHKDDDNENEHRNPGPSSHSASAHRASLAHDLIPDLPLLMHGAGDVPPEQVHPSSVATLAALIERYVAALVGAAVEAHDVFTDGEVVGGGACLGVPPLRAPGGGADAGDAAADRGKRRRVDYWDVPLPREAPGEAAQDAESYPTLDASDAGSDDESPRRRRLASLAALPDVQGFAAVDLHADARTRNYYVAAPTVMDARSFIFPVCHDAALYQRIKEVQASRRSIGRDLVDGALMEAVREEGATIGRWGTVDIWDAVLGGRAGGGEGHREADKKKGTHKGKEGTAGAAKQKNAKQSSEKKGDHGDGANLVGAGLLDADVDPSWPGLTAFSRANVW